MAALGHMGPIPLLDPYIITALPLPPHVPDSEGGGGGTPGFTALRGDGIQRPAGPHSKSEAPKGQTKVMRINTQRHGLCLELALNSGSPEE